MCSNLSIRTTLISMRSGLKQQVFDQSVEPALQAASTKQCYQWRRTKLPENMCGAKNKHLIMKRKMNLIIYLLLFT